MNEDVRINQWGCGRNKLIFSHGESNARGVMIAVRESLDIKVISVFKDNNGRFIIMYAYVQDKPFLLVNYYAPNDEGGQVQTLSEINNIIDKIEIEINTREYTNPEEIMKELKAFYSSLYTRRSTKTESECLSYLRTVNIPKLTESEKDSCEGRLTKKEIWEALNSMANNKSPGNDGLSKEFNVCFLMKSIHIY